MPQHAFLIDLTKRYEDVAQVITDIREYSAAYNPIVMEWVVREDQKQLLATEKVHEAEPGLELPARIKTIVQHMSQNGASGSTIHVVSLEGYVLAAVSNLNGPECCVVGHPIRSIEKNVGRSPVWVPTPLSDNRPYYRPPGPSLSSGRSEGLSIEEAVALAKRVLREGGHTSSAHPLHQNSLRPQMVFRDRRATKNQSDFTSRMLVSTIVEIGLREGWLHRQIYEGRSGYEYIWIEEDRQHPTPVNPAPQPAAPPQQTPAPIVNSHADLPAAKEHPGPSATDSKQEASPTSDEKTHPQKPNYRDTAPGQMEFFLREEEIGSPANARPFLFAAVRQVLAETPADIDGGQLWSEVSQIASKAAEGKTRVQDWDRTTECFLNMLFGANLLLDEREQPIPRDYSRWSAKVKSHVKEDFELRAEAYLAYRIIVRRGGIQGKELPTLGLAIYQQGKNDGPSPREIKTNAASLIAYLEQIRLVSIQDGKINPSGC
jgi:hypothetical protein